MIFADLAYLLGAYWPYLILAFAVGGATGWFSYSRADDTELEP